MLCWVNKALHILLSEKILLFSIDLRASSWYNALHQAVRVDPHIDTPRISEENIACHEDAKDLHKIALIVSYWR
jgi:hypothetical protein